jgi:hypothetical protein
VNLKNHMYCGQVLVGGVWKAVCRVTAVYDTEAIAQVIGMLPASMKGHKVRVERDTGKNCPSERCDKCPRLNPSPTGSQ